MFIKMIWSWWKNILKYKSYTTHGKTMHLTSFLKNEGYENKHEDIECNICSTSRPQTSIKWKINKREASNKKKYDQYVAKDWHKCSQLSTSENKSLRGAMSISLMSSQVKKCSFRRQRHNFDVFLKSVLFD